MKKVLSLILALAMALTTCITLGYADEVVEATEYLGGTITNLCVNGDVIYVLCDNGQIASRPFAGGDMTVLGTVRNSFAADSESKPEEGVVAVDRLFVKDGALWGASISFGQLYRLTDEGGAFAPVKQPVTLDTVLGADDASSYMVRSCFYQDGYLYIAGIKSSNSQFACRVSLETGARQNFSTKLYLMAPWGDGLVAGYIYDLQTMANAATTEEFQKPVDLALFDPEGDRATVSFQTTIEGIYGGYAVTEICADKQSIYYKAGARVYGMDMQTGQTRISAYTGEGILEGLTISANSTGAVYANGMMLSGDGDRIAALKLDAVDSGVLRIFGELGSEAHQAFVQHHPDIPVDVSGEYTADIEKITQAMVADTETFDVLVLNYSQMPVDRLVKKGYCQPLESYAEIMSRVEKMLPKYVEGLYTDGHLYAVPCNMEASGIYYNTELWEQLGLTEDDLPKTYAEFYDFLANYMYDYGEDNPDIVVFDYSIARQLMYTLLINQYIEYCTRSGIDLRFDTPLFRELMQGFASIDFEELTRITGETQALYNPKSLFMLYNVLTDLSADMTGKKPLLLSMAKDEPPFVSCTLTVLAINPRTRLLDNAVKYVSEYLDNLGKTSANITLYPANNEPVTTPNFDQAVEQYASEIAKAEAALQTAAEENKAEMRENVEFLKQGLEAMEQYRYTVSPERIAEYRETIEPLLAVQGQSVFVGGGEGINEVNSLLLRYLDGDMVLDQLVKELDGRVRLMELEDR